MPSPVQPEPVSDVQARLARLRRRLDAAQQVWSSRGHEDVVAFYVDILPRLMGCERATLFLVDPAGDRIWSKVGTLIGEQQIVAPPQDSVVGRVVATGHWVVENDPSPERGFHREVAARTGFVTRNLVCAPIRSPAGHGVTGALQVLNRQGAAPFSEADAALLQRVADHLAGAVESLVVHDEVRRLSRRLDRELVWLRSAYLGDVPLVAESASMRAVMDMVRTLSATPVNVLIQGENGTGKEVIARLLHELGERRDRPFIAVNCASIPETLMESEFFGFERGAFTGAVASHHGRFEEAAGGTLFLDEVADLPLSIQPKFLRAIQEGEGSRLGSSQVRRYDFRVISASNRDLRAAVARGAFREDLFYRLFAVEVRVPPLRERPEDVVPLARAFLRDTSRRFGKAVAGFSPPVVAAFERHPWPGNVRQLKREVERLVALTPAGETVPLELCSDELRGAAAGAGGGGLNLPARVQALEVSLIHEALRTSRGQRAQAARLLGITRQGLHKKLKRLGVAGP
jgi:transcriptional regulator with GAF, ATPase, and Fis domain